MRLFPCNCRTRFNKTVGAGERNTMHTFISYSSKDGDMAQIICDQLEARDVKCWMAPRDIPAGSDFPQAIIDGIAEAGSFVLVLSDNSNVSRHVSAEVERAFSKSKPVFPVRIREVQPSKGLELFISQSHWIDALAPPLDSQMDRLASAIHGLSTGENMSDRLSLPGTNVPEKRRELSRRLGEVDVVDVACGVIETGDTGLDFAPVVSFGHMATVDPTEIEQAQAIQKNLKRHAQAPRGGVLNIAVFGPPDTGRMFAIQQIARSVGGGPPHCIEVDLPSNVDADALVPFYRDAQDAALLGQTPLLFFNGFDVAVGGRRFGWLQHLVPTMRNGVFADGEKLRPLGNCVLCFAAKETESCSLAKQEVKAQNSRGPLGEFLSLVHCSLDVAGINPLWPEDRVHVLSRALLLRALLRMRKCRVQTALQRALVSVPHYHRQARSMEAIIVASDTSQTGGVLTGNSLPSDNELNEHIDAEWLREALRSAKH